MSNDRGKGPVSFRLAWRWKESGVSGSTPWMDRGETVEAWLESFNRRSGERVDHWIEVIDADARVDVRGFTETRRIDSQPRVDGR